MDVLDFDSQDEEEGSHELTPADSLEFDLFGKANSSYKQATGSDSYLMPPRFSEPFHYQHSTLCTSPQSLFAPPSKFSIPQAFQDPSPFSNHSLRRQQSTGMAQNLNISNTSKGKRSSTVSLISPTCSLERKMQENLEHDLSWLNRESASISPIRAESNHDFGSDVICQSSEGEEVKESSDPKSNDFHVMAQFDDSFHFKEEMESSDNIFPSKILPLEPTDMESELVLPRISPIATAYLPESDQPPKQENFQSPEKLFPSPRQEARSKSRSPSNDDDKPQVIQEMEDKKLKSFLEMPPHERDLPQTPPIPLLNSHSTIISQHQSSRRFTFSHAPSPQMGEHNRRHTFGHSSSTPQALLHSSTLNISSNLVNIPDSKLKDVGKHSSQELTIPDALDEPSLRKIEEIKLNPIFETEAYKETLAHTDIVLKTMEDRCKIFLLPNPSTFSPEQLHEQLTVSRYLIRKLHTERNMYLEKYTKANFGCQRFRHTVQEFERERNFLRQEIQLIKTKFMSGVDDPEKFSQMRGDIMNALQAENDKLRHEMFVMQESFFALRNRAECAISMLAELDAGWRSEMETFRSEYLRVQTLRDHFKTKEKETEEDLETQSKIIQKLKDELITAGSKTQEQDVETCKQKERYDELLSTLKATEEKLQSANEVITMMEKEIYDKDKEASRILIANSNLREELQDRLRPSNAYELPSQTMTHQDKEKLGLISTLISRVEKMLITVAENCPHPSTVKKVRSVLSRVDRNRNLWTTNFV